MSEEPFGVKDYLDEMMQARTGVDPTDPAGWTQPPPKIEKFTIFAGTDNYAKMMVTLEDLMNAVRDPETFFVVEDKDPERDSNSWVVSRHITDFQEGWDSDYE